MSLMVSLVICCLAHSGLAPVVIDRCHYVTQTEAQSHWIPSDAGLPVETQERGIRLPCSLVGSAPRASWDRSLDLNLSKVDRIVFSFYVEDSTKQSPTFSFYLQSDRGWFASTFSAEQGWNRITLTKAQFGIEDSPTGWKHISGLRVSAWKSVEAKSNLAIDDIRAESSSIVIVQGNRTPSSSPEYATVVGQAKVVGQVLDNLGVRSGVITDVDVEDGALQDRRIAIFPHNPNMSEREMDEVEKFIRSGGKVIGFYGVHRRLMNAIGVEPVGWKAQSFPGQFSVVRFSKTIIRELPTTVHQSSWNLNVVRPSRDSAKVIGEWLDATDKDTGLPAWIVSDTGAYMTHVLLDDDPIGKQRMMAAILGHFDVDVWKEICSRARLSSSIVGDYDSIDHAVKKGGKETAKAKRLYNAALASEARGKFVDSIDLFYAAKQSLISAYCQAAPSKVKERRAVWCHSAFGVPGSSWDQVAAKLESSGINTLMPNMLWGGRAYYPSSYLPVDESVATQGDQMRICLDAAHRHGLRVHIWKVNWNLGNAPAEFLARMRMEHRTQRDPSGKDIDWLCPSNAENFELERNSMLEVVRNYAVDGIHFDYIRYPGSEGCYCEGCRKLFEDGISVRIAHWPQDVVTGPYREKYLQFRRANITRLVKAVSYEAKKLRPGIEISAAVFADWPLCKDTVGQDWVSWIKSGYLDFVCPMDYTPSATQYDQWMEIQTRATGPGAFFCPGVGVTLDSTMSPDQVVRQILIGRKYGSSGFILFNLNEALLGTVLPCLRLGVTKPH